MYCNHWVFSLGGDRDLRCILSWIVLANKSMKSCVDMWLLMSSIDFKINYFVHECNQCIFWTVKFQSHSFSIKISGIQQKYHYFPSLRSFFPFGCSHVSDGKVTSCVSHTWIIERANCFWVQIVSTQLGSEMFWVRLKERSIHL